MDTWGYARRVQAVEVGEVLAYLILGGVCLTSDGVEGFFQMCGPAYGDKESRDSHRFAVLVQGDGDGLPGFQDAVLASRGRASVIFVTDLGI